MDASIEEQLMEKKNKMVAPPFLRFCGKYNLPKLASMNKIYSQILASGY